jgi:hypothetical protein
MCGSGDIVDGIGAKVGKLLRVEAALHLLDRVEVRSVAVQRLDVQPLALAADPIGHASAAMRGQPARDQHQRAVIGLALLDPVLDGLIIAFHCPSRRVVLGSASQGVGKIGHRPLGAAHPTSPTPVYSPPGGRRSTPSCTRSSAARSSSRSSRCAQTIRASLPPRRAPVRDDLMRDIVAEGDWVATEHIGRARMTGRS